MKIQGWKGWRCRLIVDRPTQLYLHFDFICYLLCQQTNTKDTAGQSARCREARMKMDPAKSGLLPPLASISPLQRWWEPKTNSEHGSQNAKWHPPLPPPTNLECILRNTLINYVIKCQLVSWFLIKVDLVEN